MKANTELKAIPCWTEAQLAPHALPDRLPETPDGSKDVGQRCRWVKSSGPSPAGQVHDIDGLIIKGTGPETGGSNESSSNR